MVTFGIPGHAGRKPDPQDRIGAGDGQPRLESPAVDPATLSDDRLATMAEACDHLQEVHRVLAKSRTSVVAEILRGHDPFTEWDHYPPGDVYDRDSHGQYYYHAHPPGRRTTLWGPEHGHFHTFLRPPGIPAGVHPLPLPDQAARAGETGAVSHLIGISMTPQGLPIRLFTTNRWVTGEVWYPAAAVAAMLDPFEIDQVHPSWPVNVWVTAMIRLYRPLIVHLVEARDRTLADWTTRHPGRNAYEDRDLELTSVASIDLDSRIKAVRAEVVRRGG